MDDFDLTREELLGGLPARPASALLFAIESRTAHLVSRSQQAMELFVTEEAVEERELAFLEAFAMGREPPTRITIQDIESYAPQWTSLVPDNPNVQAVVAHLLGQKYCFTYKAVPGIRAALVLDWPVVHETYRRFYRQPLETIFASQTTLADRIGWTWAALRRWPESLPPFWTAFVVIFALSLPQALLALPIAVAYVGPLPGILILVVIGLINVLTMACIAETCVRSGPIRYGRAFVGQLVTDYLGSNGSLIFSLALSIRTFLVLLAAFLGMGMTLAAFTRVPSVVWVVLVFFTVLYLLSRELKATVNVLVLLAVINLALLLPIILFAFPQMRLANLFYVNIPIPFDPVILQLVFGVILMLYFGHIYVIQCAKIVLPRDPSGRSLIRGSLAGTACITAISSIWILATGGVIIPETLVNFEGTVLTPLAEQVGASIHLLGSVLIIFLLGMSCIRCSNVLFNLVRERLPTRLQSIVVLPWRRGSLLLHRRGAPSNSPRIKLIYLGLTDGQPQFRLDVQFSNKTQRVEIAVAGHWDATALLDRLPELNPHDIGLTLEILEARPERVSLKVTSPMSLTYEGEWDAIGLHVADVSTLSDSLQQLVNWMIWQEKVSLAEIKAYTGQDESIVRTMLDKLIEQDFAQTDEIGGKLCYRIRLAPRRGRQMSQKIWQALDEKGETNVRTGHISRRTGIWAFVQWIREVMLSVHGRFFLAVSPVLIAFLVTEWLLVTGGASFARLLSFSGIITNSLTAGIFPILLLVSSRRKGDFIPDVTHWFLSHPLFITCIYMLFLINLFLHGLVIWQNPLARGSALFVGVLIIGMTLVMLRRGAFARRLVVELREDQLKGGQTEFTLIAGGQPVTTEVRLGYPEGERVYHAASGDMPDFARLQYVTFYLPATAAQELKVWAHKIISEGNSESLHAALEVHSGDEVKQFDLKLSGGQVILPLTGEDCWLKIIFTE